MSLIINSFTSCYCERSFTLSVRKMNRIFSFPSRIALLAAILLYLRWQDWKDKREELAKAEMLYKAAQEAKKRQSAAKASAEGSEPSKA